MHTPASKTSALMELCSNVGPVRIQRVHTSSRIRHPAAHSLTSTGDQSPGTARFHQVLQNGRRPIPASAGFASECCPSWSCTLFPAAHMHCSASPLPLNFTYESLRPESGHNPNEAAGCTSFSEFDIKDCKGGQFCQFQVKVLTRGTPMMISILALCLMVSSTSK